MGLFGDNSSRPAIYTLTVIRKSRSFCALILTAGAIWWSMSAASAAERWVRAGLTSNSPVWGIKGGLQFALHPGGFTRGVGGPRGLIRIGYPTLTNGSYDLINFLAVEPAVKGRKGLSELEKSSIDGRQGKMFWAGEMGTGTNVDLVAGEISSPAPGVEQLSVTIAVERFTNGAHVRLKLAQRSDAPDELRVTVEAQPDSKPIESCVITATMGNKARARIIQLRDGPISCLELYPDYRGRDFAPHRFFHLSQLSRTASGDVLVPMMTDEEYPSVVQPFGRPHFWDYRGAKVTQYWRKPAPGVSENLTCAVNGRFVYWGSRQPIPGGISFENFELREPFQSGQTVIFGVTQRNWRGLIPELKR